MWNIVGALYQVLYTRTVSESPMTVHAKTLAQERVVGGNGESALHVAIAAGDSALANVGALLEFEAEPDVRARRDGFTALHRAVCSGYLGCTLLLLRAGGDPDAMVAPEALSRVPRQPWAASISHPLFMTLLHDDAIAHALSSCLILVGGADVLHRDAVTGKVPAIMAAERGLHATAKFLAAHQEIAHPVRIHTGDEAEIALLASVREKGPR